MLQLSHTFCVALRPRDSVICESPLYTNDEYGFKYRIRLEYDKEDIKCTFNCFKFRLAASFKVIARAHTRISDEKIDVITGNSGVKLRLNYSGQFLQKSLECNLDEMHIDCHMYIYYALDKPRKLYSIPNHLYKTLNHLYLSKKDHDLVLKSQGSEEIFRAHKFILASRSQVFEELIDAEDSKSDKNKCEIVVDLSACVLKELLRYMYTGNTMLHDSREFERGGEDEQFAGHFLEAAERYKVEVDVEVLKFSIFDKVKTNKSK